jgi:exonuclease SbcD
MRVLHTADWHLGRIFHGVHLTEDQAHTLDGFCALARETQPDVVLLCGDLYDRAVPPPDAVALLDDVLARLVLDAGCAVIAISGNHDSPERLSFGGRLLAHARLHVAGRPEHPLAPITLLDEHGPVCFWPLPFSEPRVIRRVFGEAPPLMKAPTAALVEGHGAALTHLVARAAAAAREVPDARHVVLAHGSVAGIGASESERPLWIGPDGAADAAVFAPFAYAALGHHHKPQDVGGLTTVRYPGSLLHYSFGECEAGKASGQGPSVTLVDIDAAGDITREVLDLPVRRPLDVRRGELKALLKTPPTDALLKFILTDTSPVLDPLARLRERFPGALVLEQERLQLPEAPQRVLADTRVDDEALFSAFYEEMTGAPPTGAEQAAFRDVLEGLAADTREAT